MNDFLSDDAVRIGMRRQGIPDHMIERTIARRSGGNGGTIARFGDTNPPSDATKRSSRATITWPVQLTLPWSTLVSDNDKYVARIAGTMEKPHAKLNLTPEYRKAKERIRELAKSKLLGAEPAAEPVQLTSRVWVPDDLHAHDVPNFAKCVHDALEGAVYVKDRWIWRATWERAGVDVDAPRAEITITPLSPNVP